MKRNQRVSALASLVLISSVGCVAVSPMVADLPRGESTPIDGVWLDTTTNIKLEIGGGHIGAVHDYPTGLVTVKKGQVAGINLKRVGARQYEAWDPLYQGPIYLTVEPSGNLAWRTHTKAFGVYSAMFVPVTVADEAALKAEAGRPTPPKEWWTGTTVAERVITPQPPLARPPTAPPEIEVLDPIRDPGDVAFGTYHALLIGNDAYKSLPKLKSAGADVTAIGAILRKRYGFKTQELRNASRDDVLRALEKYRAKLSTSDNLLIYYAGHGWLDEEADEGYWLPVDATDDSKINWIPNATLTTSLKALRAKQVFVVADSCYSGKLTRGIKMRTAQSSDYLNRMVQKRARIVLASGGLEPVLDGGSGNHSVFAAAFIKALTENTGVLDTSSLFSRVRRDVMLGADQVPELADIRKADHQGGDFLFVPQN